MPPDFEIFEFDPRKLPADILQAVGLVIAASEQADETINLCIESLLGISASLRHAVTAQLGQPNRIAILRSVAKEKVAPPLLQNLEAAIRLVEKSTELRNKVAHRAMFIDRETGGVFAWKVTARRGVKSEVEPVSSAAIRTTADTILAAGDALMEVLISVEHDHLKGGHKG